MGRGASVYLVVCALALAGPDAAQERQAWPQRAFVTVDVPFQPLNNAFAETVTITDALVSSEKDVFTTSYKSTPGIVFDAGAGVRVDGAFGVCATGSWFQQAGDATWDLSVPDPLLANRPRTLTGNVTGLDRRETALHLHAMYAVALGARAYVMLSGGPSIFDVREDFVRSLAFSDAPGFTSILFNQVIDSTVTRTVIGFNAGADVTWMFSPHVGVGSLLRYARADYTIDPGASTPGLVRSIATHAGGLQAGVGLRLFF